jgi:hypothetical protein
MLSTYRRKRVITTTRYCLQCEINVFKNTMATANNCHSMVWSFFGSPSTINFPLPCSQQPTTGLCPYQPNPVHILTQYFIMTHLNIMLSPISSSSEWTLLLRFFRLKFCINSHFILFHFIDMQTFGEDYKHDVPH